MAKAKQKELRNRQFNVALTEHEFDQLCRRAGASGMRPVDYGRARLLADRRLASREEERAPHLAPLFLAQLSRLGNNLNQIARKMHAFGQPAPDGLQPLLEEIRAMIRKDAAP